MADSRPSVHRCWVDVSGTPVSLLGKIFVITLSFVKMDVPVKPAPGYCCIPLPSFLGSCCKFHQPCYFQAVIIRCSHNAAQGDFLFWNCRCFYIDLHPGLLSGDTKFMFSIPMQNSSRPVVQVRPCHGRRLNRLDQGSRLCSGFNNSIQSLLWIATKKWHTYTVLILSVSASPIAALSGVLLK